MKRTLYSSETDGQQPCLSRFSAFLQEAWLGQVFLHLTLFYASSFQATSEEPVISSSLGRICLAWLHCLVYH